MDAGQWAWLAIVALATVAILWAFLGLWRLGSPLVPADPGRPSGDDVQGNGGTSTVASTAYPTSDELVDMIRADRERRRQERER